MEIRGWIFGCIARWEAFMPVWRRDYEGQISIAWLRDIFLRLSWPCYPGRRKLIYLGREIATGRVQKHRVRECVCKEIREIQKV
jgi:hypothetical protein